MTDTEKSTSSTVSAMRFARVLMNVTYPIVSSYEFDFLQKERIIRERWDASTIYLIVQRPLTYFDNVVLDDKYIRFEIADGDKPPLPCRINLVAAGISQVGESIDIQIGFYSNKANIQQPIRNVGALKLYRENGDFILWWSPQKLLYEMLVKGLEVEIAEGFDPHCFLDFKVHYIGKSFSQKVWDRLTGHNKMQRILTREREVGRAPEARAPFEISLVILQITGVDDMPMIGDDADHPMAGSNPIVLTLDDNDESLERFMTQSNVHLGDEALTREVEAYLINLFKPTYNKILFNNYPNITGGMRSKGYSWTVVDLESVPAFLYTDSFSMVPKVD
ncbi:TPA: hypothetical protein PXR14_003315 [Yersinia enterocolitica]|nr:hypothetical protein [Yersinia enterocolitica]HDL8412196.1 hypothetical protein [Yersinia enterocolitica]HDM8285639.1 hypothetical protein [Yersinia enterocolitica]HEI6792379.1 hypothetical protein [Yersinia enterocolitica]HEI6810373.1 hypothetical protein [Yersinia enterocolitica]